MAERPGNEFLALSLIPLSKSVLSADLDHIGPGDNTILAGDAETALHARLFPALGDNFRVDQLQNFLSHVYHHHAAENAYLGCGQTDAPGVFQCLRHIVQQLMEPVIKLGHRAGHLAKCRVLFRQNISQCHGNSSHSNFCPAGQP